MCKILCLYRSLSQTRDTFETFTDNLELTFDTFTNSNPFIIVAIGDFNAKTTKWYENDMTSYKGLKTNFITSQFGLQQLIHEPTHLTGKSFSCIDLIVASQPNFVMESRVHSSLHSSYHHQIVLAKFDLKIFYPPLYEREIWHFDKANADLIRRSINEFSWENKFSNTDANQIVNLFNETIQNILSNFILYKAIFYDDRDPLWINSKIKNLKPEGILVDIEHVFKQ